MYENSPFAAHDVLDIVGSRSEHAAHGIRLRLLVLDTKVAVGDAQICQGFLSRKGITEREDVCDLQVLHLLAVLGTTPATQIERPWKHLRHRREVVLSGAEGVEGWYG